MPILVRETCSHDTAANDANTGDRDIIIYNSHNTSDKNDANTGNRETLSAANDDAIDTGDTDRHIMIYSHNTAANDDGDRDMYSHNTAPNNDANTDDTTDRETIQHVHITPQPIVTHTVANDDTNTDDRDILPVYNHSQ